MTWGGQHKNVTSIQQPLHDSTNESDINRVGVHTFNLTEIIGDTAEYRLLIRAHVVDAEGCYGNDGNFTYSGMLRTIEFV